MSQEHLKQYVNRYSFLTNIRNATLFFSILSHFSWFIKYIQIYIYLVPRKHKPIGKHSADSFLLLPGDVGTIVSIATSSTMKQSNTFKYVCINLKAILK